MELESLVLGVYLVIVGFAAFTASVIPAWFTGGCALVAGALILFGGYRGRRV